MGAIWSGWAPMCVLMALMLLTARVVESPIVSTEPLTGAPLSAWAVLLAYKGGSAAKTRLAAQLGGLAQEAPAGAPIALSGPGVSRPSPATLSTRLAEAMARDTMRAVLDSGAARRLIMVCGSEAAAQQARSWSRESSSLLAHRESQGIDLQTVVQPEHVRGLNAALSWACRAQGEHDATVSIAALLGDLPSLRAEDVLAALHRAEREFALGADQAFVPDADGNGTVLLAARRPRHFSPRFGPASADAHERVGAVRCDLARPTLRTDVDGLADLRTTLRLGMGQHTRAVLRDATGRGGSLDD